ncbi:Cysteine protease atg4b, variant 2 [Chamberlinius hualienensis]
MNEERICNIKIGIKQAAHKMFESCTTYESTGLSDCVDFPPSDDPVWILGKQYSSRYDLDDLRLDVKSKLWFTYRRNFLPIGGKGPTSDTGWGCMLRCGQMVLGQALILRHLGRDWRWKDGQNNAETYLKILQMFEDKKQAIYSIHQIAQMGESDGRAVGQWFGPNTVAQVLKKLAVYDEWSSIAVHIAMDNTLAISDIKKLCLQSPTKSDIKEEFLDKNCLPELNLAASAPAVTWKPLLLFIPLRLGLSEINSVYIKDLKKCFTLNQSLGLIGGRPNHACYFIGYVGKDLVYLDPHTTQQTVCLGCADPMCTKSADESYHCLHACRMDFTMLDPSVALSFYCSTEKEFDQLCADFRKLIIGPERSPLFEICNERPTHEWDLGLRLTEYSSDFQVVETARSYDTSDDEYELL